MNLLAELRTRELYFHLLKYSFLDVFPFCSFKLLPYTNFLPFNDFFQYLLQSSFLAMYFLNFCLSKMTVFSSMFKEEVHRNQNSESLGLSFNTTHITPPFSCYYEEKIIFTFTFLWKCLSSYLGLFPLSLISSSLNTMNLSIGPCELEGFSDIYPARALSSVV